MLLRQTPAKTHIHLGVVKNRIIISNCIKIRRSIKKNSAPLWHCAVASFLNLVCRSHCPLSVLVVYFLTAHCFFFTVLWFSNHIMVFYNDHWKHFSSLPDRRWNTSSSLGNCWWGCWRCWFSLSLCPGTDSNHYKPQYNLVTFRLTTSAIFHHTVSELWHRSWCNSVEQIYQSKWWSDRKHPANVFGRDLFIFVSVSSTTKKVTDGSNFLSGTYLNW